MIRTLLPALIVWFELELELEIRNAEVVGAISLDNSLVIGADTGVGIMSWSGLRLLFPVTPQARGVSSRSEPKLKGLCANAGDASGGTADSGGTTGAFSTLVITSFFIAGMSLVGTALTEFSAATECSAPLPGTVVRLF